MVPLGHRFVQIILITQGFLSFLCSGLNRNIVGVGNYKEDWCINCWRLSGEPILSPTWFPGL